MSSIGNLANLSYIDFGSNSLSGNIPAELGNLANLSYLALNDNLLEGSIPASFGNLTGLSSLILDKNKLSGLIPTELGDLTNLSTLKLQSNRLVGSIPISLSNLTRLGNLWTDIGYNGLYTNDNTLRTFLSGKDPDWETTQTIAPANMSVSPLSSTSVQVSWTPITYTADTGGYQVYYSTTPGGPYTLFDTTANKTVSSMIVNGLTPAAPYYFVIRTRTLAHTNNQNIVESEYSEEVSINTPPTESIDVKYPDGGETLDVGSIQNISWSFTGIVGNLKIEYSINNGSNWIEIVSSTENDGSFSWTIPGTPSDQCRVRISEIDGSPANISDAVFSIVYSPIISGTVTHGGIGLANVVMIGLPGNPVTDASGFYTSTVNYGWSGTAVPTLTNYNFTPPSTNYTGIAANQTTDYTAVLANQIPASERQALIDFYNSTNGDSWINNSGWKTTPLHTDGFAMPGTEESWFGISVESNNHVSSITLGSNGLVGTIPISIGNLSYLTEIYLYTNQLTGTISTSIGLLSYLEILDMGNNQLSGIIPTEIGNLGNLRFLYLYSNQLTGSIPPTIGNCTNLIRLYLDDNQLTGKIPQEICNLTSLERFDFSANNIIGKIPNCIINLASLADSFTAIDYNGLYAQEESTRSFLNSKAPGWEDTQTVAPTGVTATPVTCSSIQVNWTPIIYTSDSGFYEVYFSASPGGPYTLFGATTNKNNAFMRVTGLIPNTTYYFIVRTITKAHGYNQNRIASDDSNEAAAATFPITLALTLTSPNGGESWKAGSSHLITWAGCENTGNIKIEYSTDNGMTWSDITSSTPNDGIYNWTVPNTSSNECRVRISQNDEDIVQSDISGGMFSIMAPFGPTITVTSPNGKEKLGVGAVHEINWTDTGISGNVKIEYSTNEGQSWEIIEASLDNTGSYNWTVPDTPSSTCLVRVGEVNSDTYDVSDDVFSIVIAPTIKVTSPNGGENWEVESSQSITWTSKGIYGYVKLEFSADKGINWELIEASTPNDGIYTWTVPNIISNGCLVRISEADTDESSFDISDSEFSITLGL